MVYRFLLTLLLMLPQAYASTKYNSGRNSAVAKMGNVVIEVHQSEWWSTLWYKIGFIEDNKITWGKSIKYDNGVAPSLAIMGDAIIEVHQDHLTSSSVPNSGYSLPDFSSLSYRVGKLDVDNKRILWGPSYIYSADGISPKISVANNKLVAMHLIPRLYNIETRYDEKGKLHYRYHYNYSVQYSTGTLNKESQFVQWMNVGQYAQGKSSTYQDWNITSEGNTIAELHSYNNILWCRIGKIRDSFIEWGEPNMYLKGSFPSASISNNFIFETHQCRDSLKLCYAIGIIDKDLRKVSWIEENAYSTGIRPSVVLQDNLIVETHKSENFDSLYSNLGMLKKDKKVVWY